MEGATGASIAGAHAASGVGDGGGAGMASSHSTPELTGSLSIPIPARDHYDGRPSSAPFTVQPLRVNTASVDGLPPMGKGVLPATIFTTGDGMAPEIDPRRYAFMPHRSSGPPTPGEQTLVKHQLVRKRPQTAAGRLSSPWKGPRATSNPPR